MAEERKHMKDQIDLLCFSHLRWNFVFQRPQHLLSRCGRERRVFFIEEPMREGDISELRVTDTEHGVTVVTPFIPAYYTAQQLEDAQRALIQQFVSERQIREYVAWYYTPMGLDWFNADAAVATVYDCMDELSMFKGASEKLKHRELDLFKQADLVFTGGMSLYQYKRQMHPNVYAFPSSVDSKHFSQARAGKQDPADQAGIPHPRAGFFGVVDERFDIDLLAGVAELNPDLQLVIIGPVVKIDPAMLPRAKNIHYLGNKKYEELPAYLSGWDVAIMPFARNDATRFISPTKTPEYLAAGRPVVSTSIRDVVSPYGEKNYVRIADTPEDFSRACMEAINEDHDARIERVDPFLAQMSWDSTWRSMSELIDGIIEVKAAGASQVAQQAQIGESAEGFHV
jgi:UDP-galactopyranose mutase